MQYDKKNSHRKGSSTIESYTAGRNILLENKVLEITHEVSRVQPSGSYLSEISLM